MSNEVKPSIKDKLTSTASKVIATVKNKATLTETDKKRWSKRKQDTLTTLKGVDGISWFMIGSTVLLLGTMGFIGYKVTADTLEERSTYAYYDEALNFSMQIPQEWALAKPDEEMTQQVVNEVTGGLLFDMLVNPLTSELVPVALTTEPVKDKPISKFVTMAFKGSDSEYSYLKDKVKLMDDYMALLKGLKHTNIKVANVEDIETDTLSGILLTGTAKLDGEKIYYTQYFEEAGSNTLTITHGTSNKKDSGVEDISELLASLSYHQGDAYLPTPIKETIQKEKQESAPEQETIEAPAVNPDAQPKKSIIELDKTEEEEHHEHDGHNH